MGGGLVGCYPDKINGSMRGFGGYGVPRRRNPDGKQAGLLLRNIV